LHIPGIYCRVVLPGPGYFSHLRLAVNLLVMVPEEYIYPQGTEGASGSWPLPGFPQPMGASGCRITGIVKGTETPGGKNK